MKDQQKEKDDSAALLRVDPSATVSTETLPSGALDYLEYAKLHISIALLKREDAPMSAMQHERQARLALQLERVPTAKEALDWESQTPQLPRDEEEHAFYEENVRHGAQLPVSAFDCTVTGGDSTNSLSYVVELRLHAPWPHVPVALRTLGQKFRVEFHPLLGSASQPLSEASGPNAQERSA